MDYLSYEYSREMMLGRKAVQKTATQHLLRMPNKNKECLFKTKRKKQLQMAPVLI